MPSETFPPSHPKILELPRILGYTVRVIFKFSPYPVNIIMTNQEQLNANILEVMCAIKALVSVSKRDLSRCADEMEDNVLQVTLPSGANIAGQILNNLADVANILELAEEQIEKAAEMIPERISSELSA